MNKRTPLIYVASSWRCEYQQQAVRLLKRAELRVYDFRNPAPHNNGFAWTQIDPNWRTWTVEHYREALNHPLAEHGFKLDYETLDSSDAVVLVLPCGRSAHVEAAWAKGRGKPVWVWSPIPCEPELMYKLFDDISDNLGMILNWIGQCDRLWSDRIEHTSDSADSTKFFD